MQPNEQNGSKKERKAPLRYARRQVFVDYGATFQIPEGTTVKWYARPESVGRLVRYVLDGFNDMLKAELDKRMRNKFWGIETKESPDNPYGLDCPYDLECDAERPDLATFKKFMDLLGMPDDDDDDQDD